MARYIKANPKVAQFLRLQNDRNQVSDSNYLLWQNDMLAFGKLTELPQILEQIGGIVLAAHEAREEQDGTVIRELPTATDPRFIIEPVNSDQTEDGPVVEDPEAGDETEQPETETAEDPEVVDADESNAVMAAAAQPEAVAEVEQTDEPAEPATKWWRRKKKVETETEEKEV